MSTREDLSGLSGAEFDLRSSGFTGSPFPLSVLPVIHAELPTSAFYVTDPSLAALNALCAIR
jgi:hypothetical protein